MRCFIVFFSTIKCWLTTSDLAEAESKATWTNGAGYTLAGGNGYCYYGC